jgi:hypothetical protein
MNTTFKRLSPGVTYKAHLATRARPWVDLLQPVPGAPLASGAADVNGDLTLDLPERVELLVQRPDNTAFAVLNATTRRPPL